MRAIRQNPDQPCPSYIFERQATVDIVYTDFSSRRQRGVIEIDEDLRDDIQGFFALALELEFPMRMVTRSSDPQFHWDDNLLMGLNICSGFNYRKRAGSDDELSFHALGRAVDVNPMQNPYIHVDKNRQVIEPRGAIWDVGKPGTLHAHHPLVDYMRDRGWEWGGDWTLGSYGMIDYQHFQIQPRRG